MWTLVKEFRFEASHRLPNHDGKCARLHGHSWIGKAYLAGAHLVEDGSERGMLIDYSNIAEPIKALVEEQLDHYHLNNILENPTSEVVAQWIFEQLKPKLPMLTAIEICETCTTRCLYSP